MKQSLIRGKMSHSSKSGQARGLGAGEGALVPQFFAEQLTLSQPAGHIIPTSLLRALPNFQILLRPCTVATLSREVIKMVTEWLRCNDIDPINDIK